MYTCFSSCQIKVNIFSKEAFALLLLLVILIVSLKFKFFSLSYIWNALLSANQNQEIFYVYNISVVKMAV